MIRGLKDLAAQYGIEASETPTQPQRECQMQLEDGPPMMFRAQIAERCSLQFASKPGDLEQWKEELIRPAKDGQPCYQYDEPKKLQKSDRLYQIKIKFPYRLCSNSGQDSIIRPVLGKDGIPILPGSSVKGVFRRACRQYDETNGSELELKYCGTTDQPGQLRFHNAYPIGDWSNRMVDVVHSQQDWQVGKNELTSTPSRATQPIAPSPSATPAAKPKPSQNTTSGRGNSPTLQPPPKRSPQLQQPTASQQEDKNSGRNAVALISLYQPTMIFEFSRGCSQKEIDWSEVEKLLNLALNLGMGGKTSTGYGLAGKPDYARNDKSNRDRYDLALHIPLTGTGVISKLLGKESEFRPNLFKASLRGHLRRLLAGVCDRNSIVEEEANHWFGCTDSEGIVKLFWELSQSYPNRLTYDESLLSNSKISNTDKEKQEQAFLSQTYDVRGTLHLDSPKAERELLSKVFQFAYIMGGFGKSWRRVAHSKFYPEYPKQKRKYHIGCHWHSADTAKWLHFSSEQQLKEFLKDLYQRCQDWARCLGASANSPLNWREAWHPDRVAVYAAETKRSQAVKLFHDPKFKVTPAIGGKKPGDDRPKYVSSVWHRMLPIPENQYLEIVTVFHGDRNLWISNNGNRDSQLQPFINELTRKKLKLVWGTHPSTN